MTIREIQAKTILSKTGIPGTDWVINPYLGCQFGCKYCYAFFVGRFRHPDETWGSYVDVKINAPKLLKQELSRKIKQAGKPDIGSIFLSSVTDPYQGIEAKYQITRHCLQVFVDLDYQGSVNILTKSFLVTRDIPILRQFHSMEVGLTITSLGDPITRYLETFAPPHEERIKALHALHQAGITTYAFVGPLLPHYVWHEAELHRLFQTIKDSGVSYIFLEHINLRPYIRDRLFKYLQHDDPELITQYREAMTSEYRKTLDHLVLNLAKEYALPIAGNSTIHHPETGSWK